MTRQISGIEEAAPVNVVEFKRQLEAVYAGELASEEESFQFLMRVLDMIRAERAGITNDNSK